MKSKCYILTNKDGGAFDVYSIRADGVKNVLIFENEEDAERYVIMLEQDDSYIVGEGFGMSVTEVPLDMVLEVLGSKGYSYIYVNSDDLFIPPS